MSVHVCVCGVFDGDVVGVYIKLYYEYVSVC